MVKSRENLKVALRLLLSVAIVGAIIGLIYLVMYLLDIHDLTQEQLRDYIASYGAVAPIIYVVVSFLQVTFIPIPSTVTIIAGNYVFGPWMAFLCSYIGCLLGSIFAFFLGRLIGRPFVNWVVGSPEKVDGWLKKLKGREKILLFFMFLLPFFPDDVLCTVAGITAMTWGGFITIQLITRVTTIAGSIVFLSGEIIPYEGWGLAVIIVGSVICIVAFLLSLKYSEQINSFISKIAMKFKPRKMKINNKKGTTNILLIRHGESIANLEKIFLGQKNMDLTIKGVEQANCTASFLSNMNIDAIYSSDLTRATQTAKPLSENMNIELTLDARLREIDAGEWDLKPWGNLPSLYPEDYSLYTSSIGEGKCTGGESFGDLRRRITGAMLDISKSHTGGTIAVFSHATSILAFLSDVKGTPPNKVKELDYPTNASVSYFKYKKGKFSLVEYSRDDFLGDLVTSLPKDEV